MRTFGVWGLKGGWQGVWFYPCYFLGGEGVEWVVVAVVMIQHYCTLSDFSVFKCSKVFIECFV